MLIKKNYFIILILLNYNELKSGYQKPFYTLGQFQTQTQNIQKLLSLKNVKKIIQSINLQFIFHQKQHTTYFKKLNSIGNYITQQLLIKITQQLKQVNKIRNILKQNLEQKSIQPNQDLQNEQKNIHISKISNSLILCVQNNSFRKSIEKSSLHLDKYKEKYKNNIIIIKQNKLNNSSSNIFKKSFQKYQRMINLNYKQNKQMRRTKLYQMMINKIKYNKEIINDKTLKAYISKGNNSQLIKGIFKNKYQFTIIDQKKEQIVNFLWTQYLHENYVKNQRDQIISIHNHLLNINCIGNKKCLFKNLKQYCDKENINLFDLIPLTFHFEKGKKEYKTYQSFLKTFMQTNMKNNYWIIKPGENTNRGYGIEITNNLEKIEQILNKKMIHKNGKMMSHIVQKYICNPYLYNKRKFDIRCFLLLKSEYKMLKAFWFNQGYLRTSSLHFNLENLQNKIHLTNDAIQKNNQSYGKFQPANKLSFTDFSMYLTKLKQIKTLQEIIHEMKEIIVHVLNASYQNLKVNIGTNNFEILGLDFMIDQNLKPYLIEINNNPSYDNHCDLMTRIISTMIEDALKLVMDSVRHPEQIRINKLGKKSSNNNFERLIYKKYVIKNQKQEMIYTNIN